jgi:hypothetical protein
VGYHLNSERVVKGKLELTALKVAVPSVPAGLAGQDDPWVALQRIASDRVYEFVLRSRTCLYGPVKGTTSDSLQVDVSAEFPSPKPQPVKILRSEIVQVRGLDRDDIIYSGRSYGPMERTYPGRSAGESDFKSRSDLVRL